MRAHLHIATSTLVAAACASIVPDLPQCPPVEEMLPPPTVECQLDPAFEALERHLRTVIEEMAGPLLVRVEFDSGSSVHAVCADRTSAETQRRARTRVANRLSEITDTPPGPACLAGTRLDFNRREAGRASAQHAVSACLRNAEMVYESNANNPSNPDWADP